MWQGDVSRVRSTSRGVHRSALLLAETRMALASLTLEGYSFMDNTPNTGKSLLLALLVEASVGTLVSCLRVRSWSNPLSILNPL